MLPVDTLLGGVDPKLGIRKGVPLGRDKAKIHWRARGAVPRPRSVATKGDGPKARAQAKAGGQLAALQHSIIGGSLSRRQCLQPGASGVSSCGLMAWDLRHNRCVYAA